MPQILFLLLTVVALVCPTATAESTNVPTLAEKRAARTLSGQFRRARRDIDGQANVLAEAMQAGPYAVSEIHELIGFQLQPEVTKYREKFYVIAAKMAKQKVAQADMQEVATLQAQVNALRADEGLTKEKVKQVGDPAMERLAQVLLVDRASVLASDKRLVENRQSLLPIGRLWETADAYLAKFDTAPAAGDGEAPADKPQAVSFEQYLVQEEEIAVRLALPMSDVTRAVLAQNEKLASKLDPEEARCVLSLNLTRILLGLEPVLIDLQLTAAARDHSHDMIEHNFFAHDSPVPGKATPWDRAARFNTKASGENIAAGYSTGPAANLAWFHSPGHHKNMLGNHKRVGVGRENKHWTELFGR